MFQHIMLDVETLGLRHNAVTFQVAALAFNLSNGDTKEFSTFINTDEQLEKLGSTTDQSTIDWWKEQQLWPEMQKKMAEECISVLQFQADFRRFVQTNSHFRTKFWANGICFDIPKIEHLLGGEFCKFWNILDFRTMKTIHSGIILPRGDYGPAHDAISDCRSQAAHLKAILEKV